MLIFVCCASHLEYCEMCKYRVAAVFILNFDLGHVAGLKEM